MDSNVTDMLVAEQNDSSKPAAAVAEDDPQLAQKTNPPTDAEVLVQQAETSEPQPLPQDLVQENTISESTNLESPQTIDPNEPPITNTSPQKAVNDLELEAEETTPPHVLKKPNTPQQKETDEGDIVTTMLVPNAPRKDLVSDQSSATQVTKKKKSVGKRITATLAAIGFKRKSNKKDHKSLKESESSKTSIVKLERDSAPLEDGNSTPTQIDSNHSQDTVINQYKQSQASTVNTVIGLEEHMTGDDIQSEQKNIQQLEMSEIDKNDNITPNPLPIVVPPESTLLGHEQEQQAVDELKEEFLERNKVSGESNGSVLIANSPDNNCTTETSEQSKDADANTFGSADKHVDDASKFVDASSSNEQYIQDDHCFDSQRGSTSVLPQQQTQALKKHLDG